MVNYEDKSEYGVEDISSPTVSINSLFIVAAIAAQEERKIATGDVPAAYLNAGLDNLIYMMISRDVSEELVALDPTYSPYVNRNGSVIVILDRAIYGLVESAKLWYEYLREKLERVGLKANPVDACGFNRTTADGQCPIALNVDDVIITAKSDELLESTRVFKGIAWCRVAKHNYLGMTFKFNDKEASITMKKYIDDLLKKYAVKGNSKTPSG